MAASGSRARKVPGRLGHLSVPQSKDLSQSEWGQVRSTQELAVRVSCWPNWDNESINENNNDSGF